MADPELDRLPPDWIAFHFWCGAGLRKIAGLAMALLALTLNDITGLAIHANATPVQKADLALIVSVDVSNSVDDTRYQLQMDGIATALEDPSVVAAITSGPAGGILFSMVVWADTSTVAVPWLRISNKRDAEAVADRIRTLKRYGGEFTCLARMLRNLDEDVVPSLPFRPTRIVVDVSGDGSDNCSPVSAVSSARDELVKKYITINGLPIIEDPAQIVGAGAYRAPGSPMEYLRPLESHEQLTLEGWYRAYVMGGEFAFILPANGYADFARAMRQKFVTEISGTGETPVRSFKQAGQRSKSAVGNIAQR